jgi:hypothetical protein
MKGEVPIPSRRTLQHSAKREKTKPPNRRTLFVTVRYTAYLESEADNVMKCESVNCPDCLTCCLYTPGNVLSLFIVRRYSRRKTIIRQTRWEKRFVRFLELSGVGRTLADGTDELSANAARMDTWISWERQRTRWKWTG